MRLVFSTTTISTVKLVLRLSQLLPWNLTEGNCSHSSSKRGLKIARTSEERRCWVKMRMMKGWWRVIASQWVLICLNRRYQSLAYSTLAISIALIEKLMSSQLRYCHHTYAMKGSTCRTDSLNYQQRLACSTKSDLSPSLMSMSELVTSRYRHSLSKCTIRASQTLCYLVGFAY